MKHRYGFLCQIKKLWSRNIFKTNFIFLFECLGRSLNYFVKLNWFVRNWNGFLPFNWIPYIRDKLNVVSDRSSKVRYDPEKIICYKGSSPKFLVWGKCFRLSSVVDLDPDLVRSALFGRIHIVKKAAKILGTKETWYLFFYRSIIYNNLKL